MTQQHKKSVVILGLAHTVVKENECSLKDLGCVWTLNDWYMFFPKLKSPMKVFNIHSSPFIHPDTVNRFQLNWKKKYNESAELGTKFVTLNDGIPGIKNQERLPSAMLEKDFGVQMLQCAISVMICMAVAEGYEKIYLRGVKLNLDEYKYQVRSIMRAVKKARCLGIEVDNDQEAVWVERAKGIDWSQIPEAIKPYWDIKRDYRKIEVDPDLFTTKNIPTIEELNDGKSDKISS